MKKDVTSSVNKRSRNPHKVYQRKVKLMLAITCLSVFTACVTIVLSVLVCIRFKYAGQSTVTFAEQDAGQAVDQLNQNGDEVTEAFSDSVYSQAEVDALMEAARENASAQGEAEVLDTLQKRLMNGEGSLDIYRDLYPDYVVLVDSGKYHFIEKNESLSANRFDNEKFLLGEDGLLSYQDEQVDTYMGIDVSKYQGKIDWEKVKNAGVDFAIVRAGIRGYSEGAILGDDTFTDNVEGAKQQGIALGTYFFTQATSEEEAVEEAQFVIDRLKEAEVSLEYPVYLDVEAVSSANCRTKDLTQEQRTKFAKVFLEKIEEAGFQPALYGNMKTYMLMLDITELEEYDKWLASYSLPIYYPYDFQILQYSEKGRIPGISEPVDLNICFKKYGGED